MLLRSTFLALLLSLVAAPVVATGAEAYAPPRVVYDVSNPDPMHLKNILDRASLLQKLYGSDPFASSIVIVLHEGAIPLFAHPSAHYQTELVARARDLATGEVIRFRLCEASARMQGYSRQDFDGFIEPVPMADAEIIRLQHTGHAYLR
jgi:intracellular sulfur oxidation DsrE/DsrF family protein